MEELAAKENRDRQRVDNQMTSLPYLAIRSLRLTLSTAGTKLLNKGSGALT